MVWSREVPEKNGWFWIRYMGKYGPVKCPCEVYHAGESYHVQTARNDTFTTGLRTLYGFEDAEFGPEIVVPTD